MPNVYIESRPKGRPEGDPIDDYVVEDHADHILATFKTQRVRAILGIPPSDHVVLVTFGGIQSETRVQLPNIAGVHWIALPSVARGNVADVSRFGMSFIDVLASSDAVVTKIGYATFVEAACNGVGIVSAPRADWPESGPLIERAKQNANFALMEDGIEDTRGFRTALTAVLNAPSRMAVRASGVAEAVEIIAGIAGLSYQGAGFVR